jgi:hypothetical protein
MSPIFTALSAGAMHVAALLAAAGADMDVPDNRLVTPRHMLHIRKERLSQEHCETKESSNDGSQCDAGADITAALAIVMQAQGGEHLAHKLQEDVFFKFAQLQP